MTLSELILAFREQAPVVKGKCFYCGRQTHKGVKESHSDFHTRDHVIPQSAKGTYGGDARNNKVTCCRRCNDIKEDLTMHEFKRRSGIATFYAETLLGVRIDDLSDIEAVTAHILSTRRVEGRSIKFHGKPQLRSRSVSALDLMPSTPPLETKPLDLASNKQD